MFVGSLSSPTYRFQVRAVRIVSHPTCCVLLVLMPKLFENRIQTRQTTRCRQQRDRHRQQRLQQAIQPRQQANQYQLRGPWQKGCQEWQDHNRQPADAQRSDQPPQHASRSAAQQSQATRASRSEHRRMQPAARRSSQPAPAVPVARCASDCCDR